MSVSHAANGSKTGLNVVSALQTSCRRSGFKYQASVITPYAASADIVENRGTGLAIGRLSVVPLPRNLLFREQVPCRAARTSPQHHQALAAIARFDCACPGGAGRPYLPT